VDPQRLILLGDEISEAAIKGSAEVIAAALLRRLPLQQPPAPREMERLMDDLLLRATYEGQEMPSREELLKLLKLLKREPEAQISPRSSWGEALSCAAREGSALYRLKTLMADPTQAAQIRQRLDPQFDLFYTTRPFPAVLAAEKFQPLLPPKSPALSALRALEASKPAGEALELDLLPRRGARFKGRRIDPLWAEKVLPERLAMRLAQAVAQGVAPQECAVLLNNPAQAQAVQAALFKRGLPVALEGGERLFASPCAQDLRSLLSAIAEPHQSSIRGVLSSRLFNFDVHELNQLEGDELAWGEWTLRFRAAKRRWMEGSLGPALRAFAEEAKLRSCLQERPDGQRWRLNWKLLLEWVYGLEGARPAEVLHRLSAALQHDPQPQASGEGVILSVEPSAKPYRWLWVPYLWSDPRPSAGPALFSQGEGLGLSLYCKGREKSAAGQYTLMLRRERLLQALGRAERCTLFWGAFHGVEQSLGASLFPGVLFRDDQALRKSLKERISLCSALREPKSLSWASQTPTSLSELEFDRSWIRSSFSQMLRRSSIHARPKEDEEEPPASSPGAALVEMAGVPGGASLGTCLHRVLEEIDFASAQPALEETLGEELSAVGLELSSSLLSSALYNALQAPLFEAGPSMAQIPMEDRLNELDFILPVGKRLSGAQLAKVLAEHPGPDLPEGYSEHLTTLDFSPFRGFLSGSIDLIFRHRGLWYLVDYKSNNLGDQIADYQPERLKREMGRAHYILQAHLYMVALVRFLRARLGEPWPHLGGILYLFLRGMSAQHPPGSGVYAAQIPQGRIEALEALF